MLAHPNIIPFFAHRSRNRIESCIFVHGIFKRARAFWYVSRTVRRFIGIFKKYYIFNYISIFMNIYIGNLNYRVKEADLQQVMEEYGAVVSVKVIQDRETGKSKGFAFVEMENDAQAKQAIEELNGAEFEGRTMIVKEARPRD